MARLHLPKRTLIPNYSDRHQSAANGEVSTYYLSSEQLEYYRKKYPPLKPLPQRDQSSSRESQEP